MSDPFAALELPVDVPARMTIMHPTTGLPLRDQDGQDAYIDLYSTDSDVARKHLRTAANKRLAQRQPQKTNAEAIESNTIDYFVTLTAGWRMCGLDGQRIDVPFTPENARALYSSTRSAWLREQVDAFVSDRANFSRVSSTN